MIPSVLEEEECVSSTLSLTDPRVGWSDGSLTSVVRELSGMGTRSVGPDASGRIMWRVSGRYAFKSTYEREEYYAFYGLDLGGTFITF